MAYQAKDLSVLAYANGFTLWHYASPDDGPAVAASGYFNGAADMLRVGDLILANTATGAADPTAGVFLVRTNAAGTVDLSNLTPFGTANDG